MNVRSNAPILFSNYKWHILQFIYTCAVMFYHPMVEEKINILSNCFFLTGICTGSDRGRVATVTSVMTVISSSWPPKLWKGLQRDRKDIIIRHIRYPKRGFFKKEFFSSLFNTASSAAPQIPLLRLWHWLSDDLTTRLDLIHNSARSHPLLGSARSHPLLGSTYSADLIHV